jgi:hypothetical protein
VRFDLVGDDYFGRRELSVSHGKDGNPSEIVGGRCTHGGLKGTGWWDGDYGADGADVVCMRN